MSWIYRLFMGLAAVGLGLSLLVHLSAILGEPQPLGPSAWWLHLGVFVVWVPTAIVCRELPRDNDPKTHWKVALRGAPTWLKRLTYGLSAYAFINFMLSFSTSPPKGDYTQTAIWRGFSGYWMASYLASFAILDSAAVVSAQDSDGRKPLKKPGDEVDGWLS